LTEEALSTLEHKEKSKQRKVKTDLESMKELGSHQKKLAGIPQPEK